MNRNPIKLDFAQTVSRAPRIGWLVLAAGAALALLCATRVVDALAAKASYRDSLTQLNAPLSARATKAPAVRDPREAARGVAGRQMAQSLRSPWADLLETLEAVPKDQVALLSIEPSALKRSVRITAEARSAEAMLGHLKMLQGDRRLSDVTLISHERVAQVPGAPWRYQIQGAW